MKKLLVFLLLASSQICAHPLLWQPIVALGGGVAYTTHVGKSVFFPILDPNQDEYYNYFPTNQRQTQGLFEAFLGVEHPVLEKWLLQAGLAYTQPGRFLSQGSLIQGVDVQSQDQYQYQFSILTRQLMLQTKWMYPTHHRFYPYVLLGLGAARNTASNFTTTVPYTLSFTRLYSNNTSTTFAYRIGVGMDVDLGEHMRFGVAYRFSDLGGASLGNAVIAEIPAYGTLSQSAIYANELLAQLTYRF